MDEEVGRLEKRGRNETSLAEFRHQMRSGELLLVHKLLLHLVKKSLRE